MNFYAEAALKIKDDLDNCLSRLQDTYLTDKTIPLDERWGVYEKVAEMLPIHSWTLSIADLIITDCHYDFGYERHCTIYFTQVYEFWLENHEDSNDTWHSHLPDQAGVDAWRETILAQEYQGFVNDW